MSVTQQKRALARAMLSAPPRVLRLIGGKRRADGDLLDAQISVLLRLAELLREPQMHQLPLAQARAAFLQQTEIVDVPRTPGVTTEDRTIDGPGGPIGLRVYRPRSFRTGDPALLYFHGGGYVVGNLDSHDAVCRRMADLSRSMLISVDYRLAPEHPFPAAADDSEAAYRWLLSARGELGVGALGVGGDSAGGCLAATVCQQARRGGLEQPALQWLIYPSTHVGSRLPSRDLFAKGVFLERETIDWFMERYVPDEALRGDPRCSPLLASDDDLRGLAPALVVTAGFDALRDEGKSYADRLSKAGVAVEYRCATTMPHGFWSMGGVIREAERWVNDLSRQAGERLREGRRARQG